MEGCPATDLQTDRALGALLGVAIGDAMGMPSQTWSRETIRSVYGEITDFAEASPDQPVSAGLKAGAITDDTEQSLLLARHLIERQGGFDEHIWARSLLDWERDMRARGLKDLLGPSTRRAIEALSRGVPADEVGRFGTTNGAAMRIAPVGIATALEPLSAFVDAVATTCRLTHNTSAAIGSAAAVAAVISAGVSGSDFEHALPTALAAARLGERRGAGPTGALISERIERALALAEGKAGREAAVAAAMEIGTSVSALESVPMAFAIARLAGHDTWRAAILSAHIGDDTDTIGAISGGMCGACEGAAALPADKVSLILSVNRLDLAPTIEGLLRLRKAKSQAERTGAS
jgi:ADP-ribosylglycohydrolase